MVQKKLERNITVKKWSARICQSLIWLCHFNMLANHKLPWTVLSCGAGYMTHTYLTLPHLFLPIHHHHKKKKTALKWLIILWRAANTPQWPFVISIFYPLHLIELKHQKEQWIIFLVREGFQCTYSVCLVNTCNWNEWASSSQLAQDVNMTSEKCWRSDRH